MRKVLIEFVPGLVGGVVGGFLGYLALAYVLKNNGFWIPILPGAFAGLACGQLSTVESKRRGVLNGLVALGLAVFAQWKLFEPPFPFDGSLGGYVSHLHQLPKMTLLFIALNGLLAFWWGRERSIRSARSKPEPVDPFSARGGPGGR